MARTPAIVRSVVTAGLAVLLVGGTTAAGAQEAAEFRAAGRLCASAIAAAEPRQAIPRQLLTAIALAESGRWHGDSRESVAWPWTVTARGKGQFFPSKAAAIGAVRALRAAGVRNIDVGCMQINLHYHPDAFSDLETAFDPAANAAYAARFLAALNRETRSWPDAVGRYHSATPRHNRPYRARVIGLWRKVRGQTANTGDVQQLAAAAEARRLAAEAHRARIRAAYTARRAARREAAGPS